MYFFWNSFGFFKNFTLVFMIFKLAFPLKALFLSLEQSCHRVRKNKKKKTKVRKTGKSWGFDKICLTSDFLCLNLQCLFSKAFKWQKKINENPLNLDKIFKMFQKFTKLLIFQCLHLVKVSKISFKKTL